MDLLRDLDLDLDSFFLLGDRDFSLESLSRDLNKNKTKLLANLIIENNFAKTISILFKHLNDQYTLGGSHQKLRPER